MKQCARVWWILAPHQKPSRRGSVLANETRAALDSNWGDVVEEGYVEVEGLGGWERVAHEGGGAGPKTKIRAARTQFQFR